MSHELRTPLNSLLILAKLLADNPDDNLTGKQVEFAKTIHSSGSDLLTLINDILDLSKIESGMMTISLGDLPFTRAGRVDGARRSGRWRTTRASTSTSISMPSLPRDDPHRPDAPAAGAQEPARQRVQVHREGRRDAARRARSASGWTPGHETLDRAPSVIAFSVSDTGIGIPDEKQRIIFEAFQQADAHDAQVRRHRPRPLDQPRDRAPARRRDSRRRASQARLDVHALPAAELRRADAPPR